MIELPVAMTCLNLPMRIRGIYKLDAQLHNRHIAMARFYLPMCIGCINQLDSQLYNSHQDCIEYQPVERGNQKQIDYHQL